MIDGMFAESIAVKQTSLWEEKIILHTGKKKRQFHRRLIQYRTTGGKEYSEKLDWLM